MKKSNITNLALAGILCAVAVAGSLFAVPMFGSKCAPIQHMVNILCAVFLGPWYAVGVAFTASLLRNLLGIGSLMAFPGSMLGALLCGIAYKKFKKIHITLIAEVLGTGILGGIAAYPIAIAFMGQAGNIAIYTYIIPFLISTTAGAILSGVLIYALQKTGALKSVQTSLKR